jgi:uncharacterized protein YbjT (DUF2867 family)
LYKPSKRGILEINEMGLGLAAERSLLNSDRSIRVIPRYPDKLDPNLAAQIDIVQGSIDDASVLAEALNGIESLFWCVPQSPLCCD